MRAELGRYLCKTQRSYGERIYPPVKIVNSRSGGDRSTPSSSGVDGEERLEIPQLQVRGAFVMGLSKSSFWVDGACCRKSHDAEAPQSLHVAPSAAKPRRIETVNLSDRLTRGRAGKLSDSVGTSACFGSPGRLRDRTSPMGAWWKNALGQGSVSVVGCVLFLLWIVPAEAEQDPVAAERSILDVIQSERAKQAEATAEKAQGGEGTSEPAGGGEEKPPELTETPSERRRGQESQPQAKPGGAPSKERHWAILPEVGYSPEKGPNGGVKFTNRDMTTLHLTLDVAASAAVKGQHHLDTVLSRRRSALTG